MSPFVMLCEVPEHRAGDFNDWLCSIAVQTISGPRKVGNLFEYGFMNNEDMLFAKEFADIVMRHRRLDIPSNIHKIE